MKAFSGGVRALAVLIVVVMVMSSVPVFLTGKPLAQDASAGAAVATEVKIGWPGIDITWWNPFHIEMWEDWMACAMIYSTLFTVDQDANGPVLVLATGYYQVINPDGSMITTINLTHNAYFRNKVDPTDTTHPLTANDVAFTLQTIMANPGGSWDSYLNDITEINVINDYQLTVTMAYTKATFIDDIMFIPIVPEFWWSQVAKNKILSPIDPGDTIGSGPFYFDSMLKNSWWRFARAPNYHGATDFGWTLDMESVLFTVYSDTTAAVISMNSGIEDCVVLSGEANLFLNSLGVNANVNVIKFAVNEAGIYDVAINAIPMENRTQTYGQGNPLLLDPVVRKAIAMTENKQMIKDNLFFGLPTIADSVLQPGYWHKTPDNLLPYNPAWAKENLTAAGYADTNGDGYLEATATAYPVQMGYASVGDQLRFRLRVPVTNPLFAAIGENWVSWAKDAGIRFDFTVASENVMVNSDWYKANYDMWVWGWSWDPEPLSDLGVWLWSEMHPGGDNCECPMGPNPGDYDALWHLAHHEMNKTARKVMVDQLQQWVYDSHTEIPPIYYCGLYGVTDERWLGWGNWSAHLYRPPRAGYEWLWFDLYPNTANKRPVFETALDPTYYAVVNNAQTFSVTVSDEEGDPLTVNWTFGDGATAQDTLAAGTTSTPQTVTQTHTYTTVSMAGLPMSVIIWDGQAGHEVTSEATVYVQASSDSAPTITTPVGYDPAPPVYNGTSVTWTVSAKDAESGGPSGYGLMFTWDWGDGTFTSSRYQPTVNNTVYTDTVTHSWVYDGTYSVKVNVWDGFGLPNDPVHNVSSSAIVYDVLVNLSPDYPMVSPISAIEDQWTTCVASNWDQDPDTLRFTWDWGNNTYNVTNHPTSGDWELVTSTVMHMWSAPGNYLVTVWTDDLTGDSSHNVSIEVIAEVYAAGTNVPPTALAISYVPVSPMIHDVVTFNVTARDANSDALEFYIQFGDGGDALAMSAGGTAGAQYAVFTHSYTVADTYTVTLHVNDTTGPANHNVTASTTITVTENLPPTISIPPTISAKYSVAKEFAPQVSDPDGDTLSVWYDWGDGTPMTMGNPADNTATHTYMAIGQRTLTIYADDGQGHNVSATATVEISEANFKPQIQSIVKNPSKQTYAVDEEITFAITVSDYEGDTITLAVDFGDGTTPHSESVSLTPQVNKIVNVTHAYSEGRATAYTVTVSATDGKVHSDPSPAQRTTTVLVEAQGGGGGGISSAVYATIAIIAIAIVALLAFMLMKRKKKGSERGAPESGVASPEESPKP
jgi:ABC-type oligopeptide transport system substrate-binding subunit